jgi:hypothetical protein
MAILVDDPLWTRWGRRWAHLVSDSDLDELHVFARWLGLPRRAFHNDHYDLPEEYWPRALVLGAVPVTSRQLVSALRDAGLRHRPGPRAGRPEPSAPRPGEDGTAT